MKKKKLDLSAEKVFAKAISLLKYAWIYQQDKSIIKHPPIKRALRMINSVDFTRYHNDLWRRRTFYKLLPIHQAYRDGKIDENEMKEKVNEAMGIEKDETNKYLIYFYASKKPKNDQQVIYYLIRKMEEYLQKCYDTEKGTCRGSVKRSIKRLEGSQIEPLRVIVKNHEEFVNDVSKSLELKLK